MNRSRFWMLSSLGALSIAIGFAFTNCSKSSLSVQAETEFASTEVSPFIVQCGVASKISLAQKVDSNSIVQKVPEYILNSQSITADTRFVVQANTKCLQDEGAKSFISQAIISQGLREELISFHYDVTFNPARSAEEISAAADADNCIEVIDFNKELQFSAIPTSGNFIPPTDTHFSQQGHLTAIKYDKVHPYIFNTYNGVTKTVRVAVIDSGVDTGHEDISENLLRNESNAVVGYNVFTGGNLQSDSGLHGTHVTGILAARTNNAKGVSGVLGRMVKIMPIQASINGSGMDIDDIANGIQWAVEHDADVINMSLGGHMDEAPLILKEKLKYAVAHGVVVVVAAGNDGTSLDNYAVYPANFGKEIPGVITVGSIDAANGSLSFFSNRSTQYVEMMAPGSSGCAFGSSSGCVGIFSTVPNSLYSRASNTSPIHGTSMSTPVVSGAVAMLIGIARSRGYDLAPEQVELILKQSAVVGDGLSTFVEGSKKLDLESMVNWLDQQSNVNIVTEQIGASAYGFFEIETQPLNRVILNKGGPISLSVTLTANSTKMVSYQWYKNGRPIYGANHASLQIASAALSDGAKYHVVVSAGTKQVKSTDSEVFVRDTSCN